MLKIYISSVIIWMIVIYSFITIAEEQIIKNGWLNKNRKSNSNWFSMLFCMSAIPIIRVLIFIAICVMACMTEEQYEEWKNSKDE